jgi:HEAT repeat protein
MTNNVPFQSVVEALLDENQPFPAKFLHRFSDLQTEDLKTLLDAWPQVSERKKLSLLEDLENLSESDTITSFDELARALLINPDPFVRTFAIRLLWECEDARLAMEFMEMLQNDESIDVRAAAANALGQFVHLGELEKLPSELLHRIVDQLLEASLPANKSLIRRRALESLGYSGRSEVIPLIESAYREKSPDWVKSALWAMGRSGDERWKPEVLTQLRTPDEDTRAEAIHAAGELELASARPFLLDMLEDEEDLEMRRELIWALSRIGGEGIRAKFEELLEIEEDDEEVEFIEEAMDTLSFTEDMGSFSLIDVDPTVDFIEEDPDDKE